MFALAGAAGLAFCLALVLAVNMLLGAAGWVVNFYPAYFQAVHQQIEQVQQQGGGAP